MRGLDLLPMEAMLKAKSPDYLTSKLSTLQDSACSMLACRVILHLKPWYLPWVNLCAGQRGPWVSKTGHVSCFLDFLVDAYAISKYLYAWQNSVWVIFVQLGREVVRWRGNPTNHKTFWAATVNNQENPSRRTWADW